MLLESPELIQLQQEQRKDMKYICREFRNILHYQVWTLFFTDLLLNFKWIYTVFLKYRIRIWFFLNGRIRFWFFRCSPDSVNLQPDPKAESAIYKLLLSYSNALNRSQFFFSKLVTARCSSEQFVQFLHRAKTSRKMSLWIIIR